MAIGPQCELLKLQPLGLQHLALLQGGRWQPLRPRLQHLLLQRRSHCRDHVARTVQQADVRPYSLLHLVGRLLHGHDLLSRLPRCG